MRKRAAIKILLASVAAVSLAGCIGGTTSNTNSSDENGASSVERRQTPLSQLKTDTIQIQKAPLAGSTATSLPTFPIRVWLALTDAQRTEGLMFVKSDEMADDQGMLFTFEDERVRGFWMRNTITALDIAFARRDGTIVAIHTMPPLTLRTFSSFEPAMYALEVKAGTFERLGVVEGDIMLIPDSVFKAGQ